MGLQMYDLDHRMHLLFVQREDRRRILRDSFGARRRRYLEDEEFRTRKNQTLNWRLKGGKVMG